MKRKLTAYERILAYQIIFNAPVVAAQKASGTPDILLWRNKPVKAREQAQVMKEMDALYYLPEYEREIVKAIEAAKKEAIIQASLAIREAKYVLKENN